MIEASALWLAPGAHHPVFARYARFFSSLFRRFETIDYRAVYLDVGSQRTAEAVEGAFARMKADVVVYTQFPSSYSYLTPHFLSGLRARARVVALGFDDEIYFEQSKHFYVCCDAVITTDLDDSSGSAYIWPNCNNRQSFLRLPCALKTFRSRSLAT